MPWFAHAPANIALIKYMGKKDSTSNLPDNPSLSYTLNDLVTRVMLEHQPGRKDLWEPLILPGAPALNLSVAAQQRFLAHLQRIKNLFDYKGGFIVRSVNNFPHSSGLASSASSFAALTICAVTALCELTKRPLLTQLELACLSREGSGSSCRSFFEPWVLWDENTVQAIDLPYKKLFHQVILVSHEEKKIASSEAHLRVKTSSLYAGRPQRAHDNLKQLLDALQTQNWANAHQICWREFQDMHQLFSHASEPFTYMNDQSKKLLRDLTKLWDKNGDGPLVTMDAGPNIHLLYREDQQHLAQQFKQDKLVGNYDVL